MFISNSIGFFNSQKNNLNNLSWLDRFLWLDASDTSTVLDSDGNPCMNNGLVATWKDKSGNGRDFTQTNPDNAPVYLNSVSSIGNRPCVNIFASSSYNDEYAKFLAATKSSDFSNIQSSFSVFAVLKIIDPFNLTLFSASDNVIDRRKFGICASSVGPNDYVNVINIQQGPGDEYQSYASLGNSLDSYSIFGWNAISNSDTSFNADLFIYSPIETYLELTGNNTSQLFMGKASFDATTNYNPEATTNTEITEILIYDRILTQADITNIISYFDLKYNIF